MSSILAAPSGDHWFGTDQLGRDVFSRMVHGTRIALLVALAAVAIGAVIGSPLGMASAYYKGIADGVIMRFMDLLLSFPALLLALTLMAALGPSITSAMIAIGVVFVPIFARLARARLFRFRKINTSRRRERPVWAIGASSSPRSFPTYCRL